MPGLTLKNVRPIALGIGDHPRDIFIDADGNLAETQQPGAREINGDGVWISPGWADLHVHIWHGGTDISVRAEDAGLPTGVTALADAGSAGEASFHGLRQYVIDQRPETIKAFVNIGSIGLVACNRVPELIDTRFVDIDRTLAVIEANRDVICGVKVRASGVIVGTWGITPAKIAKRVAEIAGLPIMVHVGEPPPLLDEVFDILTPGDVVTHCFNGKQGGSIADSLALFDYAQRLADSGVLMDIGHGAASYSFDVGRRAIDAGLKPFSISTDLHARNIDGPVFDMATTVSKLHAAGLSLEDCVTAITTNPREFLSIDSPAGLAPGARADFTVFDVVDCDDVVVDSQGAEMNLSRRFEPRCAVVGAEFAEVSS
ncbi:MAG: amidohydrolase/deacetylase family metallohydrolase [Pseudomonadota bacterium]